MFLEDVEMQSDYLSVSLLDDGWLFEPEGNLYEEAFFLYDTFSTATFSTPFASFLNW